MGSLNTKEQALITLYQATTSSPGFCCNTSWFNEFGWSHGGGKVKTDGFVKVKTGGNVAGIQLASELLGWTPIENGALGDLRVMVKTYIIARPASISYGLILITSGSGGSFQYAIGVGPVWIWFRMGRVNTHVCATLCCGLANMEYGSDGTKCLCWKSIYSNHPWLLDVSLTPGGEWVWVCEHSIMQCLICLIYLLYWEALIRTPKLAE